MKKPLPRLYRPDEIRRARSALLRRSYPRLQMMLLVTITGASGLFASFVLLHEGMVVMWQHYLAAFGLAYLVFLVLLWLWLRTRAEDYDVPDSSGAGGSGGSGDVFTGGGGQFGGGGASGSFDGPDVDLSLVGDVVSNALGSAGDTLGAADELAVPLLAIMAIVAFIAAIVCSSLFMVYTAPELFAELLVDGVLSASLYHKLRGLRTRHWLETAIHRTALPFLITAVIVSAAGWAMALYAPDAHSLGEVIYHVERRG